MCRSQKISTILAALLRIAVISATNLTSFDYYSNRLVVVHEFELNATKFFISSKSEREAFEKFEEFFPTCDGNSTNEPVDFCSGKTNHLCDRLLKSSAATFYEVQKDKNSCYVESCDNSDPMILYPGCPGSETSRCRFNFSCPNWTKTSTNDNFTFYAYETIQHPKQGGTFIKAGPHNAIFNMATSSLISSKFRQSGLKCSLKFTHRFSPRGYNQEIPSRLVVRVHAMDEKPLEIWEYSRHPIAYTSKWEAKIEGISARVLIGSYSKPFHISIDCESGSIPRETKDDKRVESLVCGLANIDFVDCEDIGDPMETCNYGSNTLCHYSSNVKCLKYSKCDLKTDCADNSDETGCGMVEGSMCDFNDPSTFCNGWHELTRKRNFIFSYEKRNSTKTAKNEALQSNSLFQIERPNNKFSVLNEARKGSGSFLSFEARKGETLKKSVLYSPDFPPTNPNAYNKSSPLFGSCKMRFYVCARIGSTNWEVAIISVAGDPLEIKRRVLHGYKRYDRYMPRAYCDWKRQIISIPRQNSPYRIGIFLDHGSDENAFFAMDDFSLSPTCFDEKYDQRTYVAPDILASTCGKTGSRHPISTDCEYFRIVDGQTDHYTNEDGTQQWTVPTTGHYRIEACGGGGGSSSKGPGQPGQCVVLQSHLEKQLILRMIVGQMGEFSCATKNESECRSISNTTRFGPYGGGGGGATLISSKRDETWDVVVAGGEGSSTDLYDFDNDHVGYGASVIENENNDSCKEECQLLTPNSFLPLRLQLKCPSTNVSAVNGGYGGGGYTCSSIGGGGAGYHGGNPFGNASEKSGSNFGSSDFIIDFLNLNISNRTSQDGFIKIVFCRKRCPYPTVCRFRGDELKEQYCACADGRDFPNEAGNCDCPEQCPISSICKYANFTYKPVCECENGKILESPYEDECEKKLLHWFPIIVLLVLFFVSTFSAFIIIWNYKKRNQMMARELIEISTVKSNIYLYDDIYFGRQTRKSAMESLPTIDRNLIEFGKILGRGNFGEVLFGKYTFESNSYDIALKTISKPFCASLSAQTDFCNEALCMGTFIHDNVVRLIGIDFEQLPYLIAIEFMQGGDLLSFVKEARPNVTSLNPFHMSMVDLVSIASDVASGCSCLEEFGYIHRDISARNILLTTKANNRVAKIADFGMAKEITYGSEYYRLHGRAMLPIKWTPPEAFIDGVFTTKSDVWGFGILCWEVFSLGVVPYPNRKNEEVMLMLTEGARLEYPYGIPTRIYQLMRDCWKTSPTERPNFVEIKETLEDISHDPIVIRMSFPIHPAVRSNFAHVKSTPQSCETPQTAITEISVNSTFTEATTGRIGMQQQQIDLADRMKLHELMLVREAPYTSETANYVLDNLRKDLARDHAQNGIHMISHPQFLVPEGVVDESTQLISNNTVVDVTPPTSIIDINKLAVQNTGPALHRPSTLNFQESFNTPLLDENQQIDI